MFELRSIADLDGLSLPPATTLALRGCSARLALGVGSSSRDGFESPLRVTPADFAQWLTQLSGTLCLSAAFTTPSAGTSATAPARSSAV